MEWGIFFKAIFSNTHSNWVHVKLIWYESQLWGNTVFCEIYLWKQAGWCVAIAASKIFIQNLILETHISENTTYNWTMGDSNIVFLENLASLVNVKVMHRWKSFVKRWILSTNCWRPLLKSFFVLTLSRWICLPICETLIDFWYQHCIIWFIIVCFCSQFPTSFSL